MNNFIITILVAIISALIASFLSLQLKFCTSKEDAYRSLKAFFANVVQVISNLALLYMIAHFLRSKDPISRLEIFLLTLCVSGLLLSFVGWFLKEIIGAFKKTISMQQGLISIAKGHNEIIKNIVNENE